MKTNNAIQTGQQQSQTKFLKWVILLAFAETNFVTNLLGMMLIPIWGVLPYYYNVKQSELNWITAWLYVGPSVFARFWNVLILKHFGFSVILSTTFTAVGIWIAWFAKNDIFLTGVGYFLIGISFSLRCQIPLYLSKIWFDPDERILSTFVAQYACNVGNVSGYMFTAFFFLGLTDWDQITDKISQLFLIMSIISTISVPISFLTLIKPKEMDKDSRDKLWSSYKKVYSAFESIFDLASAGSIFSFCWIYPALIAIQQVKLLQSEIDIFVNGVTFQGVAVIIALFCALRLDKQSKRGLQQNYDVYIKRLVTFGCASLVLELLFIEYMHPKLLYVVNCMVGAGLNSIYSLLLESLQEKHYPVQELVIGTVIQEIACSIALMYCYLLNLEAFNVINFYVQCFFLIPAFCYLIVFYETKFNRFEFEV